MKLENGQIRSSATDLAKHLACRHLTALDLLVARGRLERIYRNDPTLAVLEERGRRHEAAYLEHLQKSGYDVVPDQSVVSLAVADKSGETPDRFPRR